MKLLLIRLKEYVQVDRVPVLDAERAAVAAWLKQWTCINNFQAHIGLEAEQKFMENELFEEAIRNCVAHRFDARNISVRLSYQTIENGKFWINDSSHTVWFDLADCPNPQPV